MRRGQGVDRDDFLRILAAAQRCGELPRPVGGGIGGGQQVNVPVTLQVRNSFNLTSAPFNLGVDNVAIAVGAGAGVPDTLPWVAPWLTVGSMILVAAFRRRLAAGAETPR